MEAAAIPLAGSTALQLLDRLGSAEGDSLLVHGAAGGVGSLLVQLAAIQGIRVAGSAGRARRELLGALGVEVILDREDAGLLTVATERPGGPLDAVADLVGQGLLARSLRSIREGGGAASIAAAHRRLETGHGQGKLVLRIAGWRSRRILIPRPNRVSTSPVTRKPTRS